MKIGTMFKLKDWVLGNKPGSLGYCYEVYSIGSKEGLSIIFENGCYDGFNKSEQESFLIEVGKSWLPYNFKNVIKLCQDFRKGYFKDAFHEFKGV